MGGSISHEDSFDKRAKDQRAPLLGAGGGDAGAVDWPARARELIRAATLAASSHNTQPWTFRFLETDDSRIRISADFSRRTPVVDPDDAHLFKSLGCAAENLVQAAAAQGFTAEVTVDAAHDGVDVSLRAGPPPPPGGGELARAITERQCSKTRYDGTALSDVEIGKLTAAVAGDGAGKVRAVLLLSDAEKDTAVDFVTRGDEVQLCDTGFRKELVSWLRFSREQALHSGDGLASRVAGHAWMPQWVGRALSGVLVSASGQAAEDAANIRSSAGVAVFVARVPLRRGDDDDDDDDDDGKRKVAWVEAGRAYERFALQATAMGVRTAFVNQPVEVRILRRAFEKAVGLIEEEEEGEEERAMLVVRFGRGPAGHWSLRRSLDDVIFVGAHGDEAASEEEAAKAEGAAESAMELDDQASSAATSLSAA